jgi:hypothetical protein
MGKISWTLQQDSDEIIVEYDAPKKEPPKETLLFLSEAFEKRLKHLGVL